MIHEVGVWVVEAAMKIFWFSPPSAYVTEEQYCLVLLGQVDRVSLFPCKA